MPWIKRLALAVLLVPVMAGQDNEPTNLEIFQLFNVCRPMTLYMSGAGLLSAEAVRLAAESRLRAARLYAASPDSSTGSLYVEASALGNSFDVSVSCLKFVTDRLGLHGPAIALDN